MSLVKIKAETPRGMNERGRRWRRRETPNVWRGPTLKAILAALFLSVAGCEDLGNAWNAANRCPTGQNRWRCNIQRTACHKTLVLDVCASGVDMAIAEGNRLAIGQLKPQDDNLVGTTCADQGDNKAPLTGEDAPERHTLDTCDGTGGTGGSTGAGGAPACGGAGAFCEDSSQCCSPLICSLNSCD
jgi:hypothetical protein